MLKQYHWLILSREYSYSQTINLKRTVWTPVARVTKCLLVNLHNIHVHNAFAVAMAYARRIQSFASLARPFIAQGVIAGARAPLSVLIIITLYIAIAAALSYRLKHLAAC